MCLSISIFLEIGNSNRVGSIIHCYSINGNVQFDDEIKEIYSDTEASIIYRNIINEKVTLNKTLYSSCRIVNN